MNPGQDEIEWPTQTQVLGALRMARQRGTDGWRTLAEIAGTLQCPDFGRVLSPAYKLAEQGVIEADLGMEGPMLFRYPGNSDSAQCPDPRCKNGWIQAVWSGVPTIRCEHPECPFGPSRESK